MSRSNSSTTAAIRRCRLGLSSIDKSSVLWVAKPKRDAWSNADRALPSRAGGGRARMPLGSWSLIVGAFGCPRLVRC
jgi:hypothetical protein